MASAFTHALIAAVISSAFWRPVSPVRFWVIGIACSVVPDLDVVGFGFGIAYGDILGHRGLTHSLAFAVALATIAERLARGPAFSKRRWPDWWCFFIVTASHGCLDAMTNGGLGVAFFSPISNARYFFPWRPIRVSPIGLTSFFSERGLDILRSEITWVWIPAAIFATLVLMLKVRRLEWKR